ncbi:MAG: hypothetical protein HQK84_05565 [Nitrospinae bacterium]|nr:hypothetical protein [Nitrospinota bacterium]
MEINDLVTKLLKQSLSLFQPQKEFKNDTSFFERKFIAELSKKLQKNEKWIVVNECPYPEESSGHPLADMYIETKGLKVWVEFKPLVKGFKYWSKSKFFNGDVNQTSDSIVLNDIDKVEFVIDDEDYFIFLMFLDTSGDESKRRLKSDRVFSLVDKRTKKQKGCNFEYKTEKVGNEGRFYAFYT